jgi:serine/threonine protein kinase
MLFFHHLYAQYCLDRLPRLYRQKSRTPIAIKAVSRQKLTAKLLENLESEINILKSIHHRNIVALLDCFVSQALESYDTTLTQHRKTTPVSTS